MDLDDLEIGWSHEIRFGTSLAVIATPTRAAAEIAATRQTRRTAAWQAFFLGGVVFPGDSGSTDDTIVDD